MQGTVGTRARNQLPRCCLKQSSLLKKSEKQVLVGGDRYSTSQDTVDGVHPNDAGNAILAKDWSTPLSSAIVRIGGAATAAPKSPRV